MEKKLQKERQTVRRNSIRLLESESLGLKMKKSKIMKKEELETIIRIIKKKIDKTVIMTILVNINRPITKKGILQRMGGGKGKIKDYGKFLSKDQIILQLKPKIINYSEIKKCFEILKKVLKKSKYLEIKKNSKYL